MSTLELFYYTASLVLIVIGGAIVFVGWRIYQTLVSLQQVLDTTRTTLVDIRETPKKIQNGFISSALSAARFIWGRR